jgi:5-bromo-4-chloroindolyl phosphate hydrolysis protein
MVAVVLTTERMLALIFPIWRRTHLRKLHVVCISSGVFVLWSAYVVGMLYGVNNKTFFRPITASFIGISLVYALVGYTKIYFVCRKCTKMMRAMRKHELRLSVASGKLCKENLGCQSEKKERTDEVAQKDTKFTTHGGSHEITGNIFSMVSGRLFQNV